MHLEIQEKIQEIFFILRQCIDKAVWVSKEIEKGNHLKAEIIPHSENKSVKVIIKDTSAPKPLLEVVFYKDGFKESFDETLLILYETKKILKLLELTKNYLEATCALYVI
jgi:hypothetical protein